MHNVCEMLDSVIYIEARPSRRDISNLEWNFPSPHRLDHHHEHSKHSMARSPRGTIPSTQLTAHHSLDHPLRPRSFALHPPETSYIPRFYPLANMPKVTCTTMPLVSAHSNLLTQTFSPYPTHHPFLPLLLYPPPSRHLSLQHQYFQRRALQPPSFPKLAE